MQTLNIFRTQFVKAFMAVAMCAFILLETASPAMAFGNSSSDRSQGLVEMNEMKEISKAAFRNEPRSTEEVQNNAKQGSNAVQGSANLEKMNVPANSQQTRTVAEQAEDVLENITPGH
ncbi:MAG: hypothetical protein AAFR26_21340 [Cyanobacteria bacterium J06626_4]